MRKLYVVWIMCMCLLFSERILGQMPAGIYNSTVMGYAGGIDSTFQLNNEIKDSLDEIKILKQYFKFSNNDFINSYKRINVNSNPIYLNNIHYSGIIPWENASNYAFEYRLPFTIDTTTSDVYFYKNNALADTNTAFLIVTGTGVNQAVGVALFDPNNYHNATCKIAKKCRTYGDVYTFVRPNDDFLNFWATNTNGVRKTMSYSYMSTKSNLLGINWAANCYIQINALIKYLKSKYKKVIVLGLSAGSWGAFFPTLQAEPDAAQIASGYSIFFTDVTSWFGGATQLAFDGLFANHQIDTVKKIIANQKTEYLFSYGANDGVTFMSTENSNHSTQSFLNTPTLLPNTNFFYNFTTHRFPCEALDTFFTRIIAKPKSFVKIIDSVCTQDSVLVKIDFMGIAPFSFDLYKDSVLYQSYTINTNTTYISLENDGIYQIKNIVDNGLHPGYPGEYFKIKKNRKATFNIVSRNYVCDSNKITYQLKFGGTSPWKLQYKFNTITTNLNIIDSNYFLPFPNNNTLNFLKLSDSNKCTYNINIVDSVKEQNVQINNLISVYDCDSNKSFIQFSLQGKPPFIINYLFNGSQQQFILYQKNKKIYVDNGIYNFTTVVDSNSCSRNIFQQLSIQQTPLSFNLLQPQFNCDSGKTKLSINLQGNAPFKIFYRRNGVSQSVLTTANLYNFYFTNATYAFDSIKDATCKVNFPANTVYTFNDVIPNLSVAYNSYICDSAKSAINLSPTGKAPFTVQYTNGTQIFSANIQNATTLNLSNGTYYFSKITDSNGCIKTLNQNLVLQTQPLQAMLSAPVYVCDSVKTKFVIQTSGTPPFKLFYKKNGIPQQLTYASNSFTFYFGNGDYTFDSVKDVNCTFIFSNIPPYYFSYNALTANIANPVFSCDSNAFKINFNFTGQAPFIVNYLQNGVQMQFVSNTSTYNFYATAGIYNIQQVIDANGCVKNIQQIIPIQYQTLNYTINNPVYNCDSNKSVIALHLQGNGPWTIFYRKNNISHSLVSNTNTINLFVNNGIYLFDSVKDIHCTKPMSINNSFSINIDSLQVNFSSPYYNCVSNATYLPINMSGTAPFKLYYFQNGFFQTQLFNTNFTELLLNNAQYIFTSISDVYCTKYIQQNYSIQNYPLAMNYSPPVYVCDSNKTKLHVEFEGNGPWKLYYRFNNAYYQYNTSNFSADIFFGNGNLFIDSCSDATCTLAFNTPIQFNFNYNPLNALLFSSSFNCDSNKTALPIQLSGNPPFTLAYTRNNINYQLFLNNPSQTLMLQNGLYNFTSVTDATQCIHTINQTYQYNYDSLMYSWSSPTFICDSNKAKINFDFQGNPPFTVYFHKNGIADSFQTNALHHTAYFSNGNYIIDAIRDITCYQALVTNNTFTINYSTLQTNIASPVYDCAQQVVGVDMQLQGNAPWTIHYFKTGVPPQFFTYTTYNPSYTALFGNGNYVIDSISDISNCIKQINMYVHNEYSPLNILKTNTVYNCDSNKIQINYQLYGDAPWTIQYRDLNSNSIHQVVSYYNTYSLFLQSGDYVVEQVTDYKCTQILNDSLHFAIPKLISSISSEAVSCDSNKMYVVINTPSGVSPYHIKYFENNILKYRISNNNTDTFYLNNGSFFFEKITDALGCEIIFNRNVIADYNPFYFQQLQTSYSCEKDSTLLKVAIQHATPIYFEYYQDNILRNITLQQNSAHEWYLPNGDYYFSRIYDQIGCVKLLQDSLQINEHPIQYKDSIGINCDARTYQYYITLQGKSPWYLAYNVNNKFNTVSFDSTYAVWNVPYGNYYLIDITDSNGCKQSIRREDTLQKFLMSNPVISYDNQWIYGPDFPYTYTWTRDNVVLPKVHDHKIRPYGNGTYVLTIHDSTGCSYPSNAIQINLPEEIVVYPIPTSETLHVLVNYTFGEYWEYKIFDITGKLLTKDIVNKPFEAIPVAHLAKGIYQLVIQQENDLSTARHIIRFVKE